MKISDVARACGVRVDTIRYYLKRGLLPEPERTATLSAHPGYRQFNQEDVERVRFIRKCQALGFSLDEIATLLGLRYRPGAACEPVVDLARRKIADIDEKILQLKRIRDDLEAFIADCSGEESAAECSFFARVTNRSDTDGHL